MAGFVSLVGSYIVFLLTNAPIINQHFLTLVHLVGEGGRKQKDVSRATGCAFSIVQHKAKILFKRAAEGCNIPAAMNMVLDSLIEFVNDENTSGKLLYELSSQTGEPAKIQLPSVVQNLDPTSRNGILWAISIDLPFHEQTGQYHGIFFKTKEIILRKINSIQDCTFLLYGEEVGGYKLSFPGCLPYVFISGRRKTDVLNAVDIVREEMHVHQRRCSCTPTW